MFNWPEYSCLVYKQCPGDHAHLLLSEKLTCRSCPVLLAVQLTRKLQTVAAALRILPLPLSLTVLTDRNKLTSQTDQSAVPVVTGFNRADRSSSPKWCGVCKHSPDQRIGAGLRRHSVSKTYIPLHLTATCYEAKRAKMASLPCTDWAG